MFSTVKRYFSLSIEGLDGSLWKLFAGLGGRDAVRSLRVLRLFECSAVADLDSLAECVRLHSVSVFNCGITCVSPLASCTALGLLVLSHCRELRSLDSVALAVPLVETLDVSGSSFASLGPLCGLVALRRLDISSCEYVETLEGLQHVRSLEVLLASDTAISSLGALERCRQLRTVVVSYCPNLQSLSGLRQHECLSAIDASFSGLVTIGALEGCIALQQLNVASCVHLESLAGVEELACLEVVDASNTMIASLQPLQTCTGLRKVAVGRCQALITLEGLGGLPLLSHLDISYSGISSVALLASCPALEEVFMRGCDDSATDTAGSVPARIAVVTRRSGGAPFCAM